MKTKIVKAYVPFVCALLFYVLCGVGCLAGEAPAGVRNESAARAGVMHYAWLDGTRLFIISSDAELLSFVHLNCAEYGEICGNLTGLVVLDYDVVPPWHGSVPMHAFPCHPRPGRHGQVFWPGDVEIPHGEADLMQQDVFVYEWLKSSPSAWERGPWLLRSKVWGWSHANIFRTLLCLPDDMEGIGRIKYKGEWIPLRRYSGEISPFRWESPADLPAELSDGGKYPEQDAEEIPAPSPAAFYPREYGYAEAAIHEYPERTEGYVLRAFLAIEVNDEAALRDYNQAIRLAPNIPEIYAQRAGLFFRHHMLVDAYHDARRASQIDPAYSEDKAYYMKAGRITEVQEATDASEGSHDSTRSH